MIIHRTECFHLPKLGNYGEKRHQYSLLRSYSIVAVVLYCDTTKQVIGNGQMSVLAQVRTQKGRKINCLLYVQRKPDEGFHVIYRVYIYEFYYLEETHKSIGGVAF